MGQGRNRRRLPFPTGLLLVFLPLLVAGEEWEKKPPAEWTQEDAVAVLTESPWAKKLTLYQASGRLLARLPGGRTVVYQEDRSQPPLLLSVEPSSIEPELVRAVYGVRWSTAQAVQRALVRLNEIAPVLRELRAPPPELPPDHYVVTVQVLEPPTETTPDALARERMTDAQGRVLTDETGLPYRDRPPMVRDLLAGFTEAELRERATLESSAKLRLKPASAVRHGVGASEGVSFFFTRLESGRPALPPGTAWAEFVFEGREGESIKARFRLKEMRFEGRPDY